MRQTSQHLLKDHQTHGRLSGSFQRFWISPRSCFSSTVHNDFTTERTKSLFVPIFQMWSLGNRASCCRAGHSGRARDGVTPASHNRCSSVEGRHHTKLILFTKSTKGLHSPSYRDTQKTIFSGRKKVTWCTPEASRKYLRLQGALPSVKPTGSRGEEQERIIATSHTTKVKRLVHPPANL